MPRAHGAQGPGTRLAAVAVLGAFEPYSRESASELIAMTYDAVASAVTVPP